MHWAKEVAHVYSSKRNFRKKKGVGQQLYYLSYLSLGEHCSVMNLKMWNNNWRLK